MAQGQGVNGSIQATAQVQTPITVTGTQNLAFGNVFPGIAKAVAYSDVTNGGHFSVAGPARTPVTYSFTLPANLTSGGNNLPIRRSPGCVNPLNPTPPPPPLTPPRTPPSSTLRR